MQTENRNFGTERFLLACIVLIWHANGINFLGITLPNNFNYGELTVLIFFVLSGYIISKAINRYYSNNPIGFIKNRLISLVPPIYFFSYFSFFIQCNDLDYTNIGSEMQCSVPNLLANFYAIMPFKFLLDKILQTTPLELLPILWAIRVEFLFYFICAGIIYLNKKQRINDKSKFFWILILLIGSFFGNLLIKDIKIASNMGYILYFLLGYLIFLTEKKKKNFNFLILIALIFIFIHACYNTSINERHFQQIFMESFDWISLIRGLYVITLIVLIFSIKEKFIFSDKISNYLGKISFYIYISPYVFIFYLSKHFLIDKNYLYIYVLPLTLFVSSITFNIYEKLILNIKYKIRLGKLYG